MHWTRSGDLIVMAVLGGMGTVFGPVIGAVALLVLEETLPHFIGFVSYLVTGKEVAAATEYWQLILGPICSWSCCMHAAASTACSWVCAVADALLRSKGSSKHFGGVVASDAITLDVPQGELHAVIGPNGAGKTTLIGQLTGEIAPDAGRVRFGGRDVTAVPTYRRSRLGLARSFQITSLFPDFTALDNVALAVQAHAGHSFRFWRAARAEVELREPARAALARVGLAGRADMAGLQAQPRRAPPARDRDVARHPPAHAAARRADGRNGAGRERCASSPCCASSSASSRSC